MNAEEDKRIAVNRLFDENERVKYTGKTIVNWKEGKIMGGEQPIKF